MKLIDEKIKETLNGLKDFQSKTVDYVFEQLYLKNRNKMLVADEVGLGKTIVAKGLLAKAFKTFKPSCSKRTFNVIYICSNQTLAKQNLKKLNFTGNSNVVDYSIDDDRITSLAYVSKKTGTKIPVKIKAFTPATSFDSKTHSGRAIERILLYRLLYRYNDIKPNKEILKWILKDNRRMKNVNWEQYIKESEDYDSGKDSTWVRKIRPHICSKFRKELERVINPEELPLSFKAAKLTFAVKYWSLIKRLCRLEIGKENYFKYNFSRELIGSLRFLLSRICLDYLHADIFILDEFQRYKQLIEDPDDLNKISPAIELARDIFSYDDSKILMLSATPFKPYTNDFDESNGEEHFREFNTVLKFLMVEKTESFWQEYEQDRRAFFKFLCNPDNLKKKKKEALALKSKIEDLYRTSIVRTEKLIVSKEKDTMVKQITKEPIIIQNDDINDFVAFDQITMLLNKKYKTSLPVPLEYVKSSPYSLSFLDNYQHKEKIRQFVLNDNELQQLLQKTKRIWLDREDIRQYKPLIPTWGKTLPNAKLRLLLDETVNNDGWKYLWIPPTMPHYKLRGAFKDSSGYSKTLIFSSWKLVPRMIASLVSYEFERLTVGNPGSISEKEKIEGRRRSYFKKPRSPKAQFTFRVEKEDGEPEQMNNFSLLYPCLYLATFYDPAINIIEKKSFSMIKKELKKSFIRIFKRNHLQEYVSGKGEWRKWFWLAPILLDKKSKNKQFITDWIKKGMPPSELSVDSENNVSEKDEKSGKRKHFNYAKSIFLKKEIISAGKLSENQLEKVCEHLAMLTLGSPAVCYLRSQLRYRKLSKELLDASFNIALAFLTMLNKPESIAVIRLNTYKNDYWKRILEYTVDGNIQAMLDEFLHLLINCENLDSVSEISDFISDILTIRTSNLEFDDLKIFIGNLSKKKKKHITLRSHYAIDFGKQIVSTAKAAGRQINIRQAFNSPFHPFVLASTSIGQEGLDFHLYCKKIFHWNLPSNPIDFEQREGRIHRYQGLVIRLNLAEKYKNKISFADKFNNAWKEIFKIASEDKKEGVCDLVPFWHTEPTSNIYIERFVPLYPFSIDIDRFKNLIKILAFYRLTFGQPRQDELISALGSAGSNIEFKDLIINLSPILFYKDE